MNFVADVAADTNFASSGVACLEERTGREAPLCDSFRPLISEKDTRRISLPAADLAFKQLHFADHASLRRHHSKDTIPVFGILALQLETPLFSSPVLLSGEQ